MQEKIQLFKVHMPESVIGPLNQTMLSGFIGQGPKVNEFESVLGKYFNNLRVLTLNSGTSGLHLALRIIGVGPGDEVISTPMTCTASNMPILANGAAIVWSDIDPVSGNIDPDDIERKITKNTKAIIIVHWGGYPCDLEKINGIAKRHGIKVIEDGAHAFGAEYGGERIGVHSDFIMFSLQAIKHISTVDGGLLLCKSDADYKRGKLLRWYGIDRESKRQDFRCEEDIAEWGYKFHMNDVCATIGIEQMKYVDGIVKGHRSNAEFYDQSLKNLNGVKTIPWAKNRKSAFWLYTIHVNDRDGFRGYMDEMNVSTSMVHARNDTHSCFKKYSSKTIPNVDLFTKSMISIPVGWWITASQREYIADCIRNFSKRM